MDSGPRFFVEARNRDRTGDLILTKDVLYRLSYACSRLRTAAPFGD
jgi:hypothetical protein